MIEVTFRAETQEELEEKMASMLRKCSWQCSKGGRWLTPKQVCAKFKIAVPQTLTMRLARFEMAGGSFPAKRGESGRILQMQITPELAEYFQKLSGSATGRIQ